MPSMLQDQVNHVHDQGIKAFYDGLAARDVPDHVKSGYVENHFTVRARHLRQCFDSMYQLVKGREGRSGPLKVLDVGCCNGAMTEFVLNPKLDRHGVDFSALWLRTRRKSTRQSSFPSGIAMNCRSLIKVSILWSRLAFSRWSRTDVASSTNSFAW